MDTIEDFEDMLTVLQKHRVRYLIVGGLASIYHAKPQFTKDMGIWVESTAENIGKANAALRDFGSPFLLKTGKEDEIVQIGVAPNRIDLLRRVEGLSFEKAWRRRDRGSYGKTQVNWVDLDSLMAIKARIDDPRHREDVRYLRRVREMKRGKAKRAEGRKSHRRLRG